MKYVAAAFAAFFCVPLIAAPPETVVRVIDGDTFVLAAKWSPYPLTWQVRILDIDTPEKGHLAKCPAEAEASKRASAFTSNLIARSGSKVRLNDVSHDKYGGRLDAHVTVTIGKKRADLGTLLIVAGLAQPYTGQGPKPDWCAILSAPINLIPEGTTP
jgi:endonuclease YncB( thermonuclease family)